MKCCSALSVCGGVFTFSTSHPLNIVPGCLSSHHMPPPPQEIKVILDLPDKGSLSSPWPWRICCCSEMQHWNASTCLPPLKNTPTQLPLPFLPKISSLFGWCLSVWQLFSSAWCSILLEGRRWFRTCTVTLTDPTTYYPHLHPLFFSWYTHSWIFHMSSTDVNTQLANRPHVQSQVIISLSLCVIINYLYIGESMLACCTSTCDL